MKQHNGIKEFPLPWRKFILQRCHGSAVIQQNNSKLTQSYRDITSKSRRGRVMTATLQMKLWVFVEKIKHRFIIRDFP